jgi:hypothetical protein
MDRFVSALVCSLIAAALFGVLGALYGALVRLLAGMRDRVHDATHAESVRKGLTGGAGFLAVVGGLFGAFVGFTEPAQTRVQALRTGVGAVAVLVLVIGLFIAVPTTFVFWALLKHWRWVHSNPTPGSAADTTMLARKKGSDRILGLALPGIVLLGLGVVGGLLALAWWMDEGSNNYTLIEDGLYMGGDENSPPSGTTAVLNLCEKDDPYRTDHYLWEPIPDAAPAPDIAWLRRMVQFVDDNRIAGRTVFVHCRNGVSRSGMVVVAYEMYKHRWSRDQALEFVRSKREMARPNPAFMERLLEWERELKLLKEESHAKGLVLPGPRGLCRAGRIAARGGKARGHYRKGHRCSGRRGEGCQAANHAHQGRGHDQLGARHGGHAIHAGRHLADAGPV